MPQVVTLLKNLELGVNKNSISCCRLCKGYGSLVYAQDSRLSTRIQRKKEKKKERDKIESKRGDRTFKDLDKSVSELNWPLTRLSRTNL